MVEKGVREIKVVVGIRVGVDYQGLCRPNQGLSLAFTLKQVGRH